MGSLFSAEMFEPQPPMENNNHGHPWPTDQKETITVAQQASTAASRRTGLLGLGVAAFACLGHGNASGNTVSDSS